MERLTAHERRRLARRAERQQHLAVERASAHRVIAVVGQEHGVVGRDMQAVGAREQALAPGAQEIALAVEHHHRVFAAIEHVDVVLPVDAHRADLAQ